MTEISERIIPLMTLLDLDQVREILARRAFERIEHEASLKGWAFTEEARTAAITDLRTRVKLKAEAIIEIDDQSIYWRPIDP